MGIEHLSFPDLVAEMEGKDTLKDWDVLVSYDEEKINHLLASRTAALKELCTIDPIDTLYTDETEDPPVDIPCKVILNLGAPTFKFSDARQNVSLSFPASGTYHIEGFPERKINDGLTLTVETSLVSAKGYLTGGDGNPLAAEFIPEKDENGKPAKEAAIFEPGVTNTAHAVCIDFSKPTLVTLTPPDGKKLNSTITAASAQLGEKFKKHGLKYYIAGISNTYKSESYLLRPKSFCFTTIPENTAEGIKGTLCMWIAVEGGSGNEQRQKGGSDGLVFHPRERALHPIPKDRSASIIFSYALMAKYLKTELEKKSFTEVSASNTTGKPGLEMTAKIDRTIYVPKFTAFNSYIVGSDAMEIEELKFNLNETTVGISIRPYANPQAKPDPLTCVAIAFGISKTIRWSKLRSSMNENGTMNWYYEHGDVAMGCNFGGTGHWVGPSDEEKKKNPNLIKLDISMDKAFTILPTSASQFSWFGSSREHVPDELKKVSINVPAMDLNLGGLDYFLTTNLILPGSNVFMADSPKSEKGCTYGLAMPRDCILTGTVADSL